MWVAQDEKIVDYDWKLDFGKLYEIAGGEIVGRAVLYGSKPEGAGDSVRVVGVGVGLIIGWPSHSIDYGQTLDDHGVLASVGSVGDAYDNALAESFVDSFKTELIADRVWRTRSQLELAIVEYLGWFNNARLHESLGDIPPAEYEQQHAVQEAITLAGATA
jgi:Integrase core domain